MMNKDELKELLISGKSLYNLFTFRNGQECEIYKVSLDEYDKAKYSDIVYIADLYNINTWKENLTTDEIDDVLSRSFTKHEFLEEANNDPALAKALFDFVNWQAPTLFDLLEGEEENEIQEIKEYYSDFTENNDNGMDF